MYTFFKKYKQVAINAFILVCLVLAGFDFGKDFFLGAASGAVLVMLGESIVHLKNAKQQERERNEKIFQ